MRARVADPRRPRVAPGRGPARQSAATGRSGRWRSIEHSSHRRRSGVKRRRRLVVSSARSVARPVPPHAVDNGPGTSQTTRGSGSATARTGHRRDPTRRLSRLRRHRYRLPGMDRSRRRRTGNRVLSARSAVAIPRSTARDRARWRATDRAGVSLAGDGVALRRRPRSAAAPDRAGAGAHRSVSRRRAGRGSRWHPRGRSHRSPLVCDIPFGGRRVPLPCRRRVWYARDLRSRSFALRPRTRGRRALPFARARRLAAVHRARRMSAPYGRKVVARRRRP